MPCVPKFDTLLVLEPTCDFSFPLCTHISDSVSTHQPEESPVHLQWEQLDANNHQALGTLSHIAQQIILAKLIPSKGSHYYLSKSFKKKDRSTNN